MDIYIHLKEGDPLKSKLLIAFITVILLSGCLTFAVSAESGDNDKENFEFEIEFTEDNPVFIGDRCYPLTAQEHLVNNEGGEEIIYGFTFARDLGETRNIYAILDGYIVDIQGEYLWLEDDETGELRILYRPQIEGTISWNVSQGDSVNAGDVLGSISAITDYQDLYVEFENLYPDDGESSYFTWEQIFSGSAELEEEKSIYDKWREYAESLSMENWSIFSKILSWLGADPEDHTLENLLTAFCVKMYEASMSGFDFVQEELSQERILETNCLTLAADIHLSLMPFSIFLACLIWYIEVYAKFREEGFDFIETKKDFIKLIKSLLWMVFWIVNAFGICTLAIIVNKSIVDLILTDGDFATTEIFIEATSDITADNAILQMFYRILMWISNNLLIAFATFVLLITSFAVACKLIMRQLEMAFLLSISSIFLTCAYDRKHTKWLFTRWLNSFIYIVTQTIPMALVLVIGKVYFADKITNIQLIQIDEMLILIGIACLMLKKSFLTKIFDFT